MKFAALLLLPLLATNVHATFNAFQNAASDCVSFLGISAFRLEPYYRLSFPPDRETMCFIRCISLVLDLWHDRNGTNWSTIGLNSIDPPTRQEIHRCISNKMAIIDPSDDCSRAYYALRCFRRNIPTILQDTVVSDNYAIQPTTPPATTFPPPPTTTPQPFNTFVPLNAAQIAEQFATCLTQCGVPSFNFCAPKVHPFPDTPELRCAVHCTAVQTGVFDSMDNLHAQLGRCETLDAFRFRMEMCLRRWELPEGIGSEERAYRQWLPCVLPEYERFLVGHRAELGPFAYMCGS